MEPESPEIYKCQNDNCSYHKMQIKKGTKWRRILAVGRIGPDSYLSIRCRDCNTDLKIGYDEKKVDKTMNDVDTIELEKLLHTPHANKA